ncbi:maleylpyruvate isomerase family mycothiol-dependent enzyme [Nocardioides sp. SR21]|uniref:maleylpyruvate isomerase family mycothiol-dependent enzyme n=1 Tax=Nocardioides sp. SR21 TaxID=2919501 RepID=UPI001FAA288E|nr:maleylpyruvate isomerase family mycothiol-dependent enzyme [Nocardioides sp. SR21]
MTSLVDRALAALRTEHDTLAALQPLSESQLTSPSGASEWTVAAALSHLGSGAEIGRRSIAQAAGESVADESNEEIWARWDGATPAEQAAAFVEHDAAYLATVGGLSDEQKASLVVDLGFLPNPVPVLVPVAMRLNEVANHSWDVRVGLDPSAEVLTSSAEVLVELFEGPLAFLLGFAAKPDQVAEPVRLAVPGGGIVIDGAVSVTSSLPDATATLSGPAGATVRALSGRLRDADEVSGNVSVDDLRRVFPGY